jgi:hypothetical protein
MGDADWDDVAQRFHELGDELRDAWRGGEAEHAERAAASDLEDAGDKVRAALDDLADAINRAVGSPSVRDATRRATSGLAEALSGSLQEVAAWIDRPKKP